MYLAEDLPELDPLLPPGPLFTTFVPMLTWGTAILGVIALIVGGFKLASAHHRGDHSTGVGGVIVLGASAVLTLLTSTLSSDSPATAAKAPMTVDVPTPPPAPEPPSPAPSAAPLDDTLGPISDFDVELDPMILLSILGALGAVAVAGYVGFNVYDVIALRHHAARERAEDWKKAKGVYAEVLDEFAAYQADPYAWLQRPLLESNAEPATVAFIDALAAARDLDLETMPRSPQRITAFREAANEALRTWTAADANARFTGDRSFAPGDRRKLRRAQDVMRLAIDERTPTGERTAALAKVRDLTNGLVPAPDRIFTPVVAAIETSHRKALTAGNV